MMSFLSRFLLPRTARPAPENLNPLNQPTVPLREHGWILCRDAQPQFNHPVQITDGHGALGIGMRTLSKIATDEGRMQEAWMAVWIRKPNVGILAWQPAAEPLR